MRSCLRRYRRDYLPVAQFTACARGKLLALCLLAPRILCARLLGHRAIYQRLAAPSAARSPTRAVHLMAMVGLRRHLRRHRFRWGRRYAPIQAPTVGAIAPGRHTGHFRLRFIWAPSNNFCFLIRWAGPTMTLRPNPRFEGTAEKLRFSVPRRLRRQAAPQAKR